MSPVADHSLLSGVGEVHFSHDRTIRGTFHNIYGGVDFSGKRKVMPSNVSGYNSWYYRNQWKEYGSAKSGW